MRSVKIRSEFVGNFIRAVFPRFDNSGGALVVRDQTVIVVHGDLVNFFLRLFKEGFLGGGDQRVANSNRCTGNGRILIALCLDGVKRYGRNGYTVNGDQFIHDLAEFAFFNNKINLRLERKGRIRAIYKAEILRDRIVKDDSADRCDDLGALGAVLCFLAYTDLGGRVHTERALLICHHCLIFISVDLIGFIDGEFGSKPVIHIGAKELRIRIFTVNSCLYILKRDFLCSFLILKELRLTRLALFNHGKVIRTDNHILRRNGNGFTVRRL